MVVVVMCGRRAVVSVLGDVWLGCGGGDGGVVVRSMMVTRDVFLTWA